MANRIVIDPPETAPGVYHLIEKKLVKLPLQFFTMEREEMRKEKNDFMTGSFEIHTEED